MSADAEPDADSAGPRTTRAPEAAVCGVLGCKETSGLVRVTDDRGRTRVLCRPHRKEFLGVST